MFWKKKIKNYVNFRNHKIYISNQKLLDKFDYKYFDLHNAPIQDVKKLLYRWLKEKKYLKCILKIVIILYVHLKQRQHYFLYLKNRN